MERHPLHARRMDTKTTLASGEKEEWRADITAVKTVIAFLQTTGRLVPDVSIGQNSQNIGHRGQIP